MCDMREILAAASALRAAGEEFVIATVVRVRGSGYRRPGARMLVTAERWVAGWVSGGCLESDVLRKGFWRTREQRAVLVSYDATSPDDVRWGFGLGCDGIVDVLLERAPSVAEAGAPGVFAPAALDAALDPLGFVESCLVSQERGVLATVVASDDDDVPVGAHLGVRADGACAWDIRDRDRRAWIEAEARAALVAGASVTRSAGGLEVFFEVVVPPPHLFLLGAGHDALPLSRMARMLGWHVVVVEPQARRETRRRFRAADEILVAAPGDPALARRIDDCDRAVAVVMNHNVDLDRAALAMLLDTRASYIGMLGPQSRTERLLTELGRSADRRDPRLHAPVGLDLGADTPAEIALAMLSEIQAELAHAPATRLRERQGPIHAVGERQEAVTAVAPEDSAGVSAGGFAIGTDVTEVTPPPGMREAARCASQGCDIPVIADEAFEVAG
jgi:xanthine/CO dehydrogenase XdhC/CoxF family maturation factor